MSIHLQLLWSRILPFWPEPDHLCPQSGSRTPLYLDPDMKHCYSIYIQYIIIGIIQVPLTAADLEKLAKGKSCPALNYQRELKLIEVCKNAVRRNLSAELILKSILNVQASNGGCAADRSLFLFAFYPATLFITLTTPYHGLLLTTLSTFNVVVIHCFIAVPVSSCSRLPTHILSLF